MVGSARESAAAPSTPLKLRSRSSTSRLAWLARRVRREELGLHADRLAEFLRCLDEVGLAAVRLLLVRLLDEEGDVLLAVAKLDEVLERDDFLPFGLVRPGLLYDQHHVAERNERRTRSRRRVFTARNSHLSPSPRK